MMADPKPDDANTPGPSDEPLEPERLTWAVLLAKWSEFAQSGVALPDAGEAGLLRRSIADVITLQAVWFALRQLDELDRSEQALGLDRAGVLINRHASAIRSRYRDEPMPEGLGELIADAETEYAKQKSR